MILEDFFYCREKLISRHCIDKDIDSKITLMHQVEKNQHDPISICNANEGKSHTTHYPIFN